MRNKFAIMVVIATVSLVAIACAEQPLSEKVADAVTRVLEGTMHPDGLRPFEMEAHPETENLFNLVIATDIFSVPELLDTPEDLRFFLHTVVIANVMGFEREGVDEYLDAVRFEFYDPETDELVMVVAMGPEARREPTWIENDIVVQENIDGLPDIADAYAEDVREEHLDRALVYGS